MERILFKNLPSDNKKDYCCYCGMHIVLKMDRTVEHLLPISIGGRNCSENKKPCCASCNKARGSKSYLEFLNELSLILEMLRKDTNDNSIHIERISVMIENVKYWDAYCKQWNHLINKRYIMPIHKEKYNIK